MRVMVGIGDVQFNVGFEPQWVAGTLNIPEVLHSFFSVVFPFSNQGPS
jgi:hypothetical protein